jgi:hypothetical protein
MLGNRAVPVLLCDADPVTVEDFRIVFAWPQEGEGLDEDQSLEASLMRILAEGTSHLAVDLKVCQDGTASLAAIRQAREERRPFQVAFVDLGPHPEYWGLDTAEEMRALDPALHIVLTVSRLESEPSALFARVPPADRLSVCCKPLHGFEIQHLVSAAVARRRRESSASRDLASFYAQPAFENDGSEHERLNEALGLIRKALATLTTYSTTHVYGPSLMPARDGGAAAAAASQLSLSLFDYGQKATEVRKTTQRAAAHAEVLDTSAPRGARRETRAVQKKQPPRT